jgi:glucose/arabinose dehydrogenase
LSEGRVPRGEVECVSSKKSMRSCNWSERSRRIIFDSGQTLACFALAIASVGCRAHSAEPSPIPLDQIKLPPGFHIEVYSASVPGARSMALGSNGTLFVGTREEGRVYALLDHKGADRADEVITLARGLDEPNGVALHEGSLYVAESTRIIRFDDIEARLKNAPSPVVVYDKLPRQAEHSWKYLRIGPDGKLYFTIGAPCNICIPRDDRQATISRMNPDGSDFEIYARGVRNSIGFDWDPQTGQLWFTDNGRDMMGDDIPSDELNHAPQIGMHFGYPYCHQGDISDPEFGRLHPCEQFVVPEVKLGPHVASLGMHFYTGKMFPDDYKNRIFTAEHGSWNRSVPIGYRVAWVRLNGNQVADQGIFAEGWLQGRRAWGRPVDGLVMPDGALLVSDDRVGAIYRISYRR